MLSNLASPLIDLIALILGLAVVVFKAGELKADFNSKLLLVKTELANEITGIKILIEKTEISEINNNQAIDYKIIIVEEKLKNIELTTNSEFSEIDLKYTSLRKKVSRIEDYLTRKASSFIKKETEH